MTKPDDPASDIETRLDGLRSWQPEGDRARWIRVRRLARTRRRRARVRRGLAVAAVVAVVGIGAAALTGDDDPADVDTADPTRTTTTPPTSPTTTTTDDATPTVTDTAPDQSPTTDPPASDWADLPTGWHERPAPPLSPRSGAALVADRDRLFVVGGWDFLCPPAADCALPDSEAYRDGAVLDVTSGEWTPLPDTPFPVVPASAAVVDGALHLRCGTHPACVGTALLRLRPGADAWDELPDVPDSGQAQHRLVSVGGTLYAFADSDERGETTDHRFDPATEQWVALPGAPLPALYDRRVVDADGQPLLVGGSILRDLGTSAARYDPATDSWSTVGDVTPPGFQIALVDGLVHREPHFRSASGGILDPATGTWEFWPALPAGLETDDIVGVVGSDGAAYWSTSGWVWDRRTGEYREVEPAPRPPTFDHASTTLGDRLVVHGGAVWPDDGSPGFLSDDLWVWVP